MSGGTPVGGGGYMRQRHSQGYASSSDDLEDDACSRPTTLSPSLPKPRTWVDVVENFLWIASAVFIMYYGDRHSNFIYLLWHDDRIRSVGPSPREGNVVLSSIAWKYVVQNVDEKGKTKAETWLKDEEIPLYLGMLGVGLNILFFLYTSMLAWGFRRSSEKLEISSIGIAVLPVITVLGLVSFCLFSFALWPIWSFLTLPLVFTLFMAGMVILPYLVLGTFKTQPELLRTD